MNSKQIIGVKLLKCRLCLYEARPRHFDYESGQLRCPDCGCERVEEVEAPIVREYKFLCFMRCNVLKTWKHVENFDWVIHDRSEKKAIDRLAGIIERTSQNARLGMSGLSVWQGDDVIFVLD